MYTVRFTNFSLRDEIFGVLWDAYTKDAFPKAPYIANSSAVEVTGTQLECESAIRRVRAQFGRQPAVRASWDSTYTV